MSRPKLTIITYSMPERSTGGALLDWLYIDYLSNEYEITLYHTHLDDQDYTQSFETNINVTKVNVIKRKHRTTLQKARDKFMSFVPRALAVIDIECIDWSEVEEYTTILCTSLYALAMLDEKLQKQAIVISANVEHNLHIFDPIEYMRTYRLETDLLYNTKKLAVLTEKDKIIYEKQLHNKDIQICPPIIAPSYFSHDKQIPNTILWMTNLGYEPNESAQKWLEDKVCKHLPDNTQIITTGKDPNYILKKWSERDKRIIYKGFIDRHELEREIKNASVLINPTLTGSGIQLKLIEALSMNKRVVTTTFANPFSTELISTNDPVEFANLIVDALNNYSYKQFDYQKYYDIAKTSLNNFLK
jgi:Glycosyl transferases group 1